MNIKSPLTGILMGAALAVGVSSCVATDNASKEANVPGSAKGVDVVAAWVESGAPNGSFTYKDLNGSMTDATFDADILPLMTTEGVWGEGTAACSSCHSGNTSESLHELDLTSYKGMMIGADAVSAPDNPAPLFGQSKKGATDYNWGHSTMRGRLRNNRMPPGLEFDISMENRNGPCVEVGSHGAKVIADNYGCKTTAVKMVGAWVKAGAPKDGNVSYGGGNITFAGDILPLFTQENVWGPDTAACSSCHSGNTAESLHELDLTSYEGLMIGADAVSAPDNPAPLFGQSKKGATDYNWGHSTMRGRLRNNRMPPGVEFDISMENRNGPVVLHGKRLP